MFMRKNNIITQYMFVIAALVTTFYLFFLGLLASPSADDFGFSSIVKENGIIDLVKTMYMTWQPRYCCFLINGIIFKLFGYADSLWLYAISQLFMGYIAIYLFMNKMMGNTNRLLCVSLSVLLTNIGLMSLLELGTLYWLCTANYIHEIWFTFYLIYFLFVHEGNTTLKYISVILCSIYLGGCAENYTPLLIIELCLILLAKIFINKSFKILTDKINIPVVLSLIILIFGFLAVFFGPGNEVRLNATGNRGYLDDFKMIEFVKDTFSACAVFFVRLLSKAWYYMCACGISMIIGFKYSKKTISTIDILYATGILMAIIVLSVAIGVYGTGWYVAPRAYSYMAFVLLVYSCYIGVFLGQYYSKKMTILPIISNIAIVITTVIYLYVETPVLLKYHNEVKGIKQELLCLSENNFTGVYEVKEIDKPNWQNSYTILRNGIELILNRPPKYNELYFPYEPFVLNRNPNNWRNIGILNWCKGEFELVGWDESDN